MLSKEKQMDETAKATVIIVHGTFAAPRQGVSQWYQPAEGMMPATEGFIAKLNDALQKRSSAARCWAHCSQDDQGFHWSGKNNWVDRTGAAAELGDYVLNLRKEGWCCHIVAHSHGGNAVLEALPQIAAALPFSASLGKIVTLGTPFMDTMSPILKRIGRSQRFLTGLSWIALVWILVWFILLPAIGWALSAFGFTINAVVLGIMMIFPASIIVFALLFFSRKTQNAKPVLNGAAQMQPRFLAIGSRMDEAWQLLHHMRTYPDPMAVKTNLICYLFSSMQSHISLRHQIARIRGYKSYRDLNLTAKFALVFTHLLFLESLFAAAGFIFFIIYTPFRIVAELTAKDITIWIEIFSWYVFLLLFTRIFGTAFYSAFFSPFRWCAYRFGAGAIKSIIGAFVTYFVRRRGWSVVLEIAMGLEGYPHSLPRIERYPSSVPFVKYEPMPTGAEQRALTKRRDWINRRFDDVAQTFAKMVVTAADIGSLLHTVEADLSLVHAAYYTDDECIARIADWIAAEDDLPPQARLTE
jgi:hypothetical protein